MECPNDETLLSMVEGRLRGDALATLDSHLDECDLCRELVATLASGPRLKKDELAGRADEIGRFLVLEKIGEGAMGEVFAAYDPELTYSPLRVVSISVYVNDGYGDGGVWFCTSNCGHSLG